MEHLFGFLVSHCWVLQHILLVALPFFVSTLFPVIVNFPWWEVFVVPIWGVACGGALEVACFRARSISVIYLSIMGGHVNGRAVVPSGGGDARSFTVCRDGMILLDVLSIDLLVLATMIPRGGGPFSRPTTDDGVVSVSLSFTTCPFHKISQCWLQVLPAPTGGFLNAGLSCHSQPDWLPVYLGWAFFCSPSLFPFAFPQRVRVMGLARGAWFAAIQLYLLYSVFMWQILACTNGFWLYTRY